MRRGPALLTALAALVGLVVLAAGWHRAEYGVWWPSPPDRVGACDGTFDRTGDVGRLAELGRPVRSAGRRPPVIGQVLYVRAPDPTAGVEQEVGCGREVYLSTGGGRYRRYALPGGGN